MPTFDKDRREALKLLGTGGIVFASGLAGCAHRGTGARRISAASSEDFYFLQLSDTHWGYAGPANPEAARTLPETVDQINRSGALPDFVVFTGDLTQTTDDPTLRRRRLGEFKAIASKLAVKELRFIPGEHDASLDGGAAFAEVIGPRRYSFDWKGVHFVALDNVSTPNGSLGPEQLTWLERDLASVVPEIPVVVFAHRPLFELYPSWDWTTVDGAHALSILQARKHVTVFYGHIHQEHHTTTGAIAHHAARSLIFPLPGPGSVPHKAPLAWNPSSPDHGLGYREVGPIDGGVARYREVAFAADDAGAAPIRVTARMFTFSPSTLFLELGKPVDLELVSGDHHHGFNVPALRLRADIMPGVPTRLRLVPDRIGIFPFHCDVFCGEGHEGMTGEIVVERAAPTAGARPG